MSEVIKQCVCKECRHIFSIVFDASGNHAKYFSSFDSCVYESERHDVCRCRIHGGYAHADGFERYASTSPRCSEWSTRYDGSWRTCESCYLRFFGGKNLESLTCSDKCRQELSLKKVDVNQMRDDLKICIQHMEPGPTKDTMLARYGKSVDTYQIHEDDALRTSSHVASMSLTKKPE